MVLHGEGETWINFVMIRALAMIEHVQIDKAAAYARLRLTTISTRIALHETTNYCLQSALTRHHAHQTESSRCPVKVSYVSAGHKEAVPNSQEGILTVAKCSLFGVGKDVIV